MIRRVPLSLTLVALAASVTACGAGSSDAGGADVAGSADTTGPDDAGDGSSRPADSSGSTGSDGTPVEPEDGQTTDGATGEDDALPSGPPADPAPLPALDTPTLVSPGPADDISVQPAVALGADGQLFVAFTARDANDALGIFGSVDGGAQIALDSQQEGGRNEPDACALAGGGFVAVWSVDTDTPGPDGETLQVRFRRVDESGVPVGIEDTRVSTEVPGNHWLGRVACAPDGDFVVAGVRPSAGDPFNVFFQRFEGATGEPLAPAEATDALPDAAQVYPDVAAGVGGVVGVAWSDTRAGVGDADIESVRAALYGGDAAGHLLTPVGAAGLPAAQAVISVDPWTQTALAGGVTADGQVVIRRFGPDSDSTTAVSLGAAPASSSARPTMVPTDHPDRHALVWFSDVTGTARLQTVVVGPAGVVTIGAPLGTDPMPAYRPSVAYRDGRVAVGWVEKDADLQFRVEAAVFGP